MKKHILLLAVLSIFASCKKDEKVKDNTNVCTATIDGNYELVEDGSNKYYVQDFSDKVLIEFSKQISSPKKEPIVIEYQKEKKGDTLYCTSGTIYPTMIFIIKCNDIKAYVAEHRNVPTIGEFRALIKK